MQIGVRNGALRAGQQFGEGGGLMREREMREAARAQDFRDSQLVLRMRVAMHQRDSGRGDAFGEAIKRSSANSRFIERLNDVSADADALRHLAGEFVEDRTRLVPEREEIGASLVADLQQIAEPLRDEERDVAAFALQQGVRSPSGGDAQT